MKQYLYILTTTVKQKSVKGHFTYLELSYFEYFYCFYFCTLSQRHPAHFLFLNTPFKGSLNQTCSWLLSLDHTHISHRRQIYDCSIFNQGVKMIVHVWLIRFVSALPGDSRSCCTHEQGAPASDPLVAPRKNYALRSSCSASVLPTASGLARGSKSANRLNQAERSLGFPVVVSAEWIGQK